MSDFKKLEIFIKDGFIDRYTGRKLIFPNVLRIMSLELDEAFPFHSNWKMSDCHIAYWEFMPTYDHVIPIARGGKDEGDNIVTTSQKMNSAKANFLLEEIGFQLFPAGDMKAWDGMINWYLEYIESKPKSLENEYLRNWDRALRKIGYSGT